MNLNKAVAREKGKFYKRISKVIFDERVESLHIQEIMKSRKAVHLALALRAECSFEYKGRDNMIDFKLLNELVAILRVADKYYYPKIMQSEPQEVIDQLLGVYEEYSDSYWSAIKKNIGPKNYPRISAKEAFLELAHRGFRPNRLLTSPHNDKTDYFIKGIPDMGLVHPVKIKTQPDAQMLQERLGIRGYVGYNDPNRKY